MGTGECGAGERDPRREGPAGPPMLAGQGGRALPGQLSVSSVPSCGLESVVPICREERETRRVFPVAVCLPQHPCAQYVCQYLKVLLSFLGRIVFTPSLWLFSVFLL